jgi:hypothetical protein
MSSSLSFFTQDVDAAFLNKSDLEANVDTLIQETEFLKALYHEVRLLRTQGYDCSAACTVGAESGLQVSRYWLPPPLRPFVLSATVSEGKEGQGGRRLHSHIKPNNELPSSVVQTFVV